MIPLLCAVATCALNKANCVLFKLVPGTGPKFASKLVLAMGETREVILLKVLLRVRIGAS